jgi:hypothetical protein
VQANTAGTLSAVFQRPRLGARMPLIITYVAPGTSGMMTGQIVAGPSPLEAVKYQIVIIFLMHPQPPWA